MTVAQVLNTIGIIPFIKINGALHHQYVCLGMVNMSFPRILSCLLCDLSGVALAKSEALPFRAKWGAQPRERESRFPSGHYANGKLCRAQKFIMIGMR
jgi:hypothetical protein